jgi:hypothetical protein
LRLKASWAVCAGERNVSFLKDKIHVINALRGVTHLQGNLVALSFFGVGSVKFNYFSIT